MRIRLDDAIDRVATRMTSVEVDEALAERIAQALPERSARAPQAWIARVAMGALASLAIAVVLHTFSDRSPKVLRTQNSGAPAVELRTIVEPQSNDRRTLVEPPVIARRTTVEPSSNLRSTTVAVDRPDHERSLSALELEPLEIADLPLTAGFPPH